jgi:hypothetical protein
MSVVGPYQPKPQVAAAAAAAATATEDEVVDVVSNVVASLEAKLSVGSVNGKRFEEPAPEAVPTAAAQGDSTAELEELCSAVAQLYPQVLLLLLYAAAVCCCCIFVPWVLSNRHCSAWMVMLCIPFPSQKPSTSKLASPCSW